MISAFEKMKRDSKSGKTYKTIYGQMSGTPWKKTEKRVLHSLIGMGNRKLADKISNCGKGQICGQVYCPKCRDRASKSLQKRVLDHIQKSYGSYEDSVREQLRHTTILCELVEFDTKSVKLSVSKARKDFNAFRRRFKNIWFQGAFEFELIEMNKLRVWGGKNKVKKETLGAMDRITGESNVRILVHIHGLMDLNGTNYKEVKDWCGKRWNDHPRQSFFQRVYSDQTLEDMSWKVSSYCFKSRFRDNMTFIARDFEKGDYFTNDQLSRLIKLYDYVGGQKGVSGILIGFGGT